MLRWSFSMIFSFRQRTFKSLTDSTRENNCSFGSLTQASQHMIFSSTLAKKSGKISFSLNKKIWAVLFLNCEMEERFRVKDEVFNDTTPVGPPKKNEATSISGSTSVAQTKEEIKSPYTIIGSIDETGLGLISWWNQ